MELEDFIKPLILAGVCVFAVVIVFCMNALPQLAALGEGKNKWMSYLVWGVIIAVIAIGVLLFGYSLWMQIAK